MEDKLKEALDLLRSTREALMSASDEELAKARLILRDINQTTMYAIGDVDGGLADAWLKANGFEERAPERLPPCSWVDDWVGDVPGEAGQVYGKTVRVGNTDLTMYVGPVWGSSPRWKARMDSPADVFEDEVLAGWSNDGPADAVRRAVEAWNFAVDSIMPIPRVSDVTAEEFGVCHDKTSGAERVDLLAGSGDCENETT